MHIVYICVYFCFYCAGAFLFIINLCPPQKVVTRKRVLAMLVDMMALDDVMSVMTLGTAGDMNVTCATHVIRVPVILAVVAIPTIGVMVAVVEGGITTDVMANILKNVVEIITLMIGSKSVIF